MIPGDPLQTEQGGAGTDADDGVAACPRRRINPACASRIELDPMTGNARRLASMNAAISAGIAMVSSTSRASIGRAVPAASRGRAIRAATGGAGHRCEGQASADSSPPRHHLRLLLHWHVQAASSLNVPVLRRREVGGQERQIGVADLRLPEGRHERHAMPDHQLMYRASGRCAVPERRGRRPDTSAGEPCCPAPAAVL